MRPPIRILVVDTDADTLGICQALAGRGAPVRITASDGAGAMARMAEVPQDIVILEILMPQIDGIELLLALKRRHPATKVIAISAGGACLSRETVLHWATRLGADAVLEKPFDTATLDEAIQVAFQTSLFRSLLASRPQE